MDRRQISDDGIEFRDTPSGGLKGTYAEILAHDGDRLLLTTEEAVRLRDALNEWLEEKGVE